MRVRRSPHLVAYWRDRGLLARNYATGQTTRVTPFVWQILELCAGWQTERQICAALGLPTGEGLPDLLERLVDRDLLEAKGRPADPKVRAMSALDPWNPEAGFFHTATRDVPFSSTREANRFARLQASRWPMPPAVKVYPRAPSIDLPRPRQDGEYPRVLMSRRTWRRFSATPITRDELATILGLAAGVQQWVAVGSRKVALKTSPSGGARHPIEAYVVVRHVAGLRPGIYHYGAARHALERIGGPVSKDRMRAYLPNSGYFADASAMVFFTAIFERILWRYPYSRAYRAALVEAGHVCQTFCLTATWLGLAPYCVMGLADTLIEADLGIDGISESVLYAAGVGRPPAGSTWAPLVRGTLNVRPNRRMTPRRK